MTQLLVSVRSAEEASDALAGGAAIIDVKEPARGALGCADGETLQQIAQQVGGRAVLSAALGELSEANSREVFSSLIGYRYAKVGLAGMAGDGSWATKWIETAKQLPDGVGLVAVVYADWETCNAPPPQEILRHAVRNGCQALLVDTFLKNGRSTFQAMPPRLLQPLLAAARDQRIVTVLAGSLGLSDLSEISAMAPDVLGVRGAVCTAGRAGKLQTQLVAQLVQALRGVSKCST